MAVMFENYTVDASKTSLNYLLHTPSKLCDAFKRWFTQDWDNFKMSLNY